MVSKTMQEQEHQQCLGQSSTSTSRSPGKKALLAALTIAGTTCSSMVGSAEAFQPQPPVMVASFGSSRTTNTKLNYVVFGGDQATADNIGIQKSKTKITKTKPKSKTNNNYRHGYVVANHDTERSFWLHALENLESSSSSSDRSLWGAIARAFGPKELRETTVAAKKDAVLVRVGDSDLDIALAVPTEEWKDSYDIYKNIVSVQRDPRRNSHQLVTIRVGFPEGSSFDEGAFTFEDELTAVIRQVRLLEETANEKLGQ